MPMLATLGNGTAKAYSSTGVTLPPVPGYIAWYTGDSWTGTRWNDLSGNANHVTTISGTVTATQSLGTKNANKKFNILQGSTGTSLTWPTLTYGSAQPPTAGTATSISFYATGGVGTTFTTTNPPFGTADNTADAGWIINTGNSTSNNFVYDLGANYSIGRIGFYSTYTGGARGGNFQIDYSTDGSTYTSGANVGYSTSGGGLYTYNFGPFTGRYFRVYCSAWTNTHAPRTATVQFYTASGVAIPPATYTLFHVARYNGTEGRIFSGTGGTNWLSGFWSALSGQAFHMGWLTNNVTDYYADNWVLSTDQNFRYRGYSGGSSNESTGGGGSNAGPSMVINGGSQPAEVSDWQIAEILVYASTLSATDYVQVENYFKGKYNL